MAKKELSKRQIPMERTPSGLLHTLYDEMDAFLNGDVSSKHAFTVSRVANSIIKTLPFTAKKVT
jgi:hypothetical protein